LAVDRFHKDKKDRAALRRRIVRANTNLATIITDDALHAIPTDIEHERYWDEVFRCHQIEQPVSSGYLHPDPDRRALVDAWLREKSLGAAA
jgi:hypothetical protein